jgi:hypothetical protein
MKAFHTDPKITTKHLTVAKKSVDIVKSYFERLGFLVFDIRDPSANGHDMTVAKNGRSFRVEVKTVLPSTRSFRVKAVKPNRKNDDWIALVMGENVVIQPMKDHLSACGKDGTRHVTELVGMISALGEVNP